MQAVAWIHSRDVIHGDLSPGNLFLTKDGVLKVIDFGLATAYDPDVPFPIQEVRRRGTYGFTPPEWRRAREVLDPRVGDLYSAAAVFYWLVTGERAQPARLNNDRRIEENPGLAATLFQYEDQYPPSVLEACVASLRLDPTARPEDAFSVERIARFAQSPHWAFAGLLPLLRSVRDSRRVASQKRLALASALAVACVFFTVVLTGGASNDVTSPQVEDRNPTTERRESFGEHDRAKWSGGAQPLQPAPPSRAAAGSRIKPRDAEAARRLLASLPNPDAACLFRGDRLTLYGLADVASAIDHLSIGGKPDSLDRKVHFRPSPFDVHEPPGTQDARARPIQQGCH